MLHFQLMVSVPGSGGWRLELPDPDTPWQEDTGLKHTRTWLGKQLRGCQEATGVPQAGVQAPADTG